MSIILHVIHKDFCNLFIEVSKNKKKLATKTEKGREPFCSMRHRKE